VVWTRTIPTGSQKLQPNIGIVETIEGVVHQLAMQWVRPEEQ
jgi:hypothetical protein